MRNLILQYCNEITTDVHDGRFLLYNSNAMKDETYYIVTKTKVYSCCVNKKSKEIFEVPEIVGAEYLVLQNEICLATAVGEVLLVNPVTKTSVEGTFCDVGIESMSWSPDQEVVAFITKAQNLVVMTSTYEPLMELPLTDECDNTKQFVNVGWGKKETQFHGTEGKQAAKKSVEVKAALEVNDLPQQIELSWRADGAYFAVSCVCRNVGRMFKVFDREGKLCYTSERVENLQSSIAWRPCGTWICMPQQTPNKSIIALFEKNGLRHGEIVLPVDVAVERIVSIKWSADSNILSLKTHAENMERLYLYTTGNYHWYLKQVLNFPGSNMIEQYCWDQRIGSEQTLHVLHKNGKHLIYRWRMGITRCLRSGVVAVIDGKQLLVTSFAHATIPPPMCAKTIELEDFIISCAFQLDDFDHIQICVCTASRELHFFFSTVNDPTVVVSTIRWRPQSDASDSIQLCNIHYHFSGYIIGTHTVNSKSSLILLNVDDQESFYKLHNTMHLKFIVNALALGSINLDSFFIQSTDNDVYRVMVKPDSSMIVERRFGDPNQQPPDQIEWYSLTDDCKDGLVRLRYNQFLYHDNKCIDEDVTSFSLAGNYLLYTKLNTLHFLRLKDKRHVTSRKIERGAKLVTTMVKDSRVVMQLPRGNLEVISPRVLVFEIISDLLNVGYFTRALGFMRKHRINLNIICDHDMSFFAYHINKFLLDNASIHWLCLFITSLQNEDYTQTMYASYYDEISPKYPANFKVEEKVNYICNLLLEGMERMEKHNGMDFQFEIITAYAKLGKLDRALQRVWQQKLRERTSTAGHNSDELFKYLLYLSDVNELYNVALGTYDFGMVLFVAQRSQKDPKEYLPFLNTLKSYEVNYRKFKIDEYLKNYAKALTHIAYCDEDRHEEALEFIKKHELYEKALELYVDQPKFYKKICIAFADHLRGKAHLAQASIMYERGEEIQQALLSAKHVLDWQRALILAHKDGQDVGALAQTLGAQLQERERHKEAYELLKKYGQDFGEALKVLLQGKHFLQALYEARLYALEHETSEDYVANLIDGELKSYCTTLESSLKADQETFISHYERLQHLRLEQAKKQQANEMGNHNDSFGAGGDHMDESDLLSDTTSLHSSRYTNSSRGTGKTFRSSKNRRKHERKLLSLKPGNPFEDIALIDALHNQITNFLQAQQQHHWHDTCKALYQLKLDAQAIKLQGIYKNFVHLIKSKLDDIWRPELTSGNTVQQTFGPTVDYVLLRQEQRYALLQPLKRCKPDAHLIEWELL